jgi:hypothetical protein
VCRSGTVCAGRGAPPRALWLLAKHRGYGIVVEDLEFAKKKGGLRERGPARDRRLSGFAYAKFFLLLQARCQRERLVDMSGTAPDAPAKMCPRIERRRWRGVCRLMRKTNIACTARSGLEQHDGAGRTPEPPRRT